MISPVAVRILVLNRDKRCFVSRMERGHVCRDQWGIPHPSDDERLLTLDHVKQHRMMGRKAPTDEAHLVAMCSAANVGVPSRELRAAEREYLATLYPEAWGRKANPVSGAENDAAGDGSTLAEG